MTPRIENELVIRLRDLREFRGLTQRQLARLSGVGEKTISSYETGARIGSLKLDQLRRILRVYGVTESVFFAEDRSRLLAAIADRVAASVAPRDLPRQQPDPLINQHSVRVLEILQEGIESGLSPDAIITTAREILQRRAATNTVRGAA